MKKYLLLFMILFLTACQDIGDNKPLLTPSKKRQPIFIVNPNRHLNIADFWIRQLENPSKIIMNHKKIQKFNDRIAHKQGLYSNFKDLNRFYGSSWIRSTILESFKSLKRSTRYFSDNSSINSKFYKQIKSELNLSTLKAKKRTTRYAMTINYTNQRIIPTQKAMLKRKNQIYFDRNQNSALDIATPIAILHSTKDGSWHYGIAPTSSGWVRDQDIVFGKRKQILNYLNSKNFIVTTASKTSLLIKGVYHDYMRMGVKIPYLLSVDDNIMVQIPTRNNENNRLIFSNATVKKRDIHIGYLPYTQENILIQAFKFLHQPYGWGGMFGEQDCSKFIQEIYATTGLYIPRNSASQSRVGQLKIDLNSLNRATRLEQLEKSAKPAISILHLKGHIVLYIGNHNGEPFIIHTVWGSSSRHFALGRTAVTSLNFNGYLNKIDLITNIASK